MVSSEYEKLPKLALNRILMNFGENLKMLATQLCIIAVVSMACLLIKWYLFPSQILIRCSRIPKHLNARRKNVSEKEKFNLHCDYDDADRKAINLNMLFRLFSESKKKKNFRSMQEFFCYVFLKRKCFGVNSFYEIHRSVKQIEKITNLYCLSVELHIRKL